MFISPVCLIPLPLSHLFLPSLLDDRIQFSFEMWETVSVESRLNSPLTLGECFSYSKPPDYFFY